MDRYKIVRYFAPHLNRRPRTIKSGVTLEEAQRHCNDPRTRKDGEYFDGYETMTFAVLERMSGKRREK